MKQLLPLLSVSILLSFGAFAQTISDDFEGNGNINSWFGDNCLIDTNETNPDPRFINTSATVMKYHDVGGLFANVRFDVGRNLNLSTNNTFTLKLYVPSAGITGNQPNQISLKLQDGNLAAPWSTQSEIIHPIILNNWQTITFDFANDPYINLDPNSAPPTQRTDFNRVVIQLNGENNTDQVLGYIDDFYYFDTLVPSPNFNHLVWSDECNGNGAIDGSKWFHQTQLPLPGGWFNGEVQHYTNRQANSYQSNGNMTIMAKKETFTDQGVTKQHTSARLNSKFAFTYGRVEVRAKLPTGVGTWPAIWLLGQNIDENGAYWDNLGFGTTSWPQCGEIDIMEHWGNNQNYVQSATHTPSSFGNTVNHGGQTIPTASSAFHVYALEWTSDKLVFSVDSVVHYTYQPAVKNLSTWPFDLPHYILLNTAIQGSISPNFTQSPMDIDYVRVYQESPVGIDELVKNAEPIAYPNPVVEELNIRFQKANQGAIRGSIYQLDGKQVWSDFVTANYNTITLREEVASLKTGMYILLLDVEGQQQRVRFIKQ